MATLEKDEIGVLDIQLIQGDSKTISLTFNQVDAEGLTVPIDLTAYESIRLDVKSRKDAAEKPFISWRVGSGLTILGDDNEVLKFSFGSEFLSTAADVWYYDIKFNLAGEIAHYIEGQITVKPVITK